MPESRREFNLSLAENTIKETKEEAGLDISIKMVIAVQDKDKRNEEQIRMCFESYQQANDCIIINHCI